MINWQQLNRHLQRLLDREGSTDFVVSHFATAKQPADSSLIFASQPDEAMITKLAGVRRSVIILPENVRSQSEPIVKNSAVIYCDDPRYRYAEILNAVVTPQDLRGPLELDPERQIYVGPDVSVDGSAVVEPGATIAANSRIEAGACIMTGARIGPNVVVGKYSVIKENCVVGGWGYGYAISPGKHPMRLPHLGGVVIGEYCEVGSFTTVCSGTIEPTIIKDHAKIDDHVHIAHNCIIEEDAMVVACAEVSGSVRVGKRSWLGPNCAIIDRITIGDDCVVGMGAVVLKSLPDGSVVAGNPAKLTSDIKKQSELLKLMSSFLESQTAK